MIHNALDALRDIERTLKGYANGVICPHAMGELRQLIDAGIEAEEKHPRGMLVALASRSVIGPVEAMTAAVQPYPSGEPSQLEWPDWALAVLCQRLAVEVGQCEHLPTLIPVESVA